MQVTAAADLHTLHRVRPLGGVTAGRLPRETNTSVGVEFRKVIDVNGRDGCRVRARVPSAHAYLGKGVTEFWNTYEHPNIKKGV